MAMDMFPMGMNKYTDGGVEKTAANRVMSAQFGDGYEQVAPDGINTDISTFSVTWDNVKLADAEVIMAFLEPRLSLKPFLIQLPGQLQPIQVKCTSPLVRSYTNNYVNSITAEFKRDYTMETL